MADWLVERGIAEDRALLVGGDRVLAARVYWPGEPYAGEVLDAKLTTRRSGSARGVATAATGLEILLDKLPPGLTEGSALRVMLTRPPIAERGRMKQAQGRMAEDGGIAHPFAPLGGTEVRRFPAGLWEDLWDAAASGEIGFAGGSLLFSVTPAMTLVDIDGDGSPGALSLAAIEPLARALRQFDCGGSIGVDFPTIADKPGRKAVDAALDKALARWPHERTAMNGFGFVQIVARLTGPSLLHRMASARVAAAARMALRRAEMAEGAGITLLTVHPAVRAKLDDAWLAELERRTGRPYRIVTDPSLAIEAAQAQIVAPDR